MLSNVPFVAATLSKWVAWGPVRITKLFGFNNQSTDCFVQFHAKPTVANGDVPAVKSIWAPTLAAFSWDFAGQPITLPELLVAISTTEVNLTAPGAGGGLDMTVIVESDHLVTAGTTIVGDLTSAVASKQVWAEGAGGAKRLLRMDIINNAGAKVYAVIQASDAASTSPDSFQPIPIASGGTLNMNLGRAGYRPYMKTGAGVERYGCTVRMATDGGGNCTLPYSFDAGANYNMRGIYE